MATFGQTVGTAGVFNFKSLYQAIMHLIKDSPKAETDFLLCDLRTKDFVRF